MLRDDIIRVKDDEDIPIVIVGNKADLEDQRAVDRAKAFSLSQRWNAPYYEASARTRSRCALSTLQFHIHANRYFFQLTSTRLSLTSVGKCCGGMTGTTTFVTIHILQEQMIQQAGDDAEGNERKGVPFYDLAFLALGLRRHLRKTGGSDMSYETTNDLWTCPIYDGYNGYELGTTRSLLDENLAHHHIILTYFLSWVQSSWLSAA